MTNRYLALTAAALVLLTGGTAQAAPATVQLRVEGPSRTIFEGPVATDGKTITKGVNTIPCDGTLGGTNAVPGPTATSALDDGALAHGFDWDAAFFGDFFVNRVAEAASDVWGFAVNFQPAAVGGCQQQVHAGDEVLFASDFFGGPNFAQEPLLRLDGPARAVTGQSFTVTVTDGQTGAPYGGATVGGVQAGAGGGAALAIASPGLVHLKAEAPGAIRSNAVSVCVSATGADDCGLPAAQLGGPGSGAVKDSAAPRARIGGPHDGRRYRRGPRLLSGTASDDVGVTQVKLALRRHARGQPCRWWSGSRERFAGRGCGRKVFFRIDSTARWSYLLPRRLAPGRYVLDVKAFDRARNRDERFVRGKNRVVFYVGRSYGPARAGAAAARPARVGVMVAGRSETYADTVRAGAVRVRVGRRSCKVGPSTPLAALARVLRKKRLGYRLRDYGSCSRSTASGSGQLFVRRVGEDANRGNDGWFYKVNDRAPEVGAGDPAARLRSGARVLWFYCVFDEAAGSCQRSLRVVPASGAAGKVTVAVRGYDNAGRWRAVAGATVTAGARQAVSGADGVAALDAEPGKARYVVRARGAGYVDSFPTRVSAG